MLHLLGRSPRGDRRTRDIRLAPAAYSEHSLVLVREHFDEPGPRFRPVVENPSRTRAAGQSEMAGDETFDKLCFGKVSVLRFENWLEVDRVQIAALFGEVSALVKNVGDAATHAGGKISAAGSEHQNQTPGHVFAAVVADSFDYGGRSGVANGKALTSDSIEKRFATGG